MTIQQLPVYTGEIPALGQEQSQFNTNVSDKLAYDAQLVPAQNIYATEANAIAAQVQSDASDAESSAAAASASASGLGYQGLWPDTGGSANKGDTYQTQSSGTPTGQYFTALQNTTVDPVSDDVNWRSVISLEDVQKVTEIVFKSTEDMVAGLLPSGGNVELNEGDSALISGELCSLFKVSTSGEGDGIDSFVLNSGLYANKVSSISGDQYYSYKQRHLLGESLKKLRDRVPINFTWYGDSNSERYNGAVYLEFEDAIKTAYGSVAVDHVNDRADSGFNSEKSFNTYQSTHDGDISIINFGTNDASTQDGFPLEGNIKNYLYWIERLIVRELEWGKAVILVTPLPTRFDKAWTSYAVVSPSDLFPSVSRVDAYQMGNALKYLGDKYSIPVVDSVEMIAPFKDSAWASGTQSINDNTPMGDVVHFTEPYLRSWGARIAACIIGNLDCQPYIVSDGDMLTVTSGSDPVTIGTVRAPSSIYTYYNDSIFGAFAQGDDFVGNRALVIQTGETVTFSFYAASDNLVIYPVYYMFSSSEVEVFIDNKNVQPPVKLDVNLQNEEFGDTEYSYSSVATTVNRPIGYPEIPSKTETNRKLWVSTKGWHAVTVKVNSGFCAVSGLVFMSYGHDQSKANQVAFETTKHLQDWTSGNLEDADSGVNYYAYSSAVGMPTGATGGVFYKSENADSSVGFLKFNEAQGVQGRVWTKYKLSSVWGGWIQS